MWFTAPFSRTTRTEKPLTANAASSSRFFHAENVAGKHAWPWPRGMRGLIARRRLRRYSVLFPFIEKKKKKPDLDRRVRAVKESVFVSRSVSSLSAWTRGDGYGVASRNYNATRTRADALFFSKISKRTGPPLRACRTECLCSDPVFFSSRFVYT